MDLALNNLQRLICHKTQTTNHLHAIIETYIQIKIRTYKTRICINTQKHILIHLETYTNIEDIHMYLHINVHRYTRVHTH